MSQFDLRIAAIPEGQDNLVTRAQLLGAGLTDEQIQLRVQQRQLMWLHDGVYLHGSAPPTWAQRARAAELACGPTAVASHATAVALYGLDGAAERDEIHVTMGQTNQALPKGVHVYRSRRVPTGVRTVKGIRCTSVERSLIDYASVADVLSVERAVESALDRGFTLEGRIWEALELEGGRGIPGAKRLRQVMLRRPNGRPAKSFLEVRLGKVRREDGIISELVRNHPVSVGDEAFEIDFAAVHALVAIEADSRKFHATATQRARDKRRQAKLEAVGWLFIRVTWTDTARRPQWVVDQIRAAIDARLAAPGPLPLLSAPSRPGDGQTHSETG